MLMDSCRASSSSPTCASHGLACLVNYPVEDRDPALLDGLSVADPLGWPDRQPMRHQSQVVQMLPQELGRHPDWGGLHLTVVGHQVCERRVTGGEEPRPRDQKQGVVP